MDKAGQVPKQLDDKEIARLLLKVMIHGRAPEKWIAAAQLMKLVAKSQKK